MELGVVDGEDVGLEITNVCSVEEEMVELDIDSAVLDETTLEKVVETMEVLAGMPDDVQTVGPGMTYVDNER